jgi:Peptidase family M23
VRLESVEVIDPLDQRIIGARTRMEALGGEDVTAMVRRFSRQGTLQRQNYALWLGPGQAGVLYVDVTVTDRRDLPSQLGHRVRASQPRAPGSPEFTVIGGVVAVSDTEAVVLSPPLKGDRWLVADGCCAVIGPHRFTLVPLSGMARAPEHFAIDFVQLDAQGRLYVGDIAELHSFPFYGAEVLAAAPGTVVGVVNDLPDQVPGRFPADASIETAAGNHVIVDMGNGRFALYAHLIPGSVAVQVGAVVSRGQRLGLLGNSGNTDAPHLHFQVMDSPSVLNTTGLPFVFDTWTLEGHVSGSLDDVNKTLFAGQSVTIDPAGSSARTDEMPLILELLGFK